MAHAMSLLGDRSASFIVRIWREQTEYEGALPEWRGSIEHVGSGQRAFFRDLDAIAAFMKPHLEAIGLNPGDTFWERMSSSLSTDAAPADGADPVAPVLRANQGARRK
jgi:hypothetical protein